jgi:alcohol dehydrogenase
VTVAGPGPLSSGAPVVFGVGAVHRLPSIVSQLDAHRVLLVCGRRSFDASGAADVLPELRTAVEVHRWDDFSPNTDADDLEVGLHHLHRLDPDLVLGVGGGSAMDMAKLLCVFADHRRHEPLVESIRSGRRIEGRRRSLVLVPTTSGSGSEATHFAVVYVDDEKFSVAGDVLRPDAVVLDPRLTTSASPYQRATSGIDAVCQAIESLWATGATPQSREHARVALTHLLPAIEGFVLDPSEATAIELSLGSHIAGRAIDISKTTAAHALSYGITKRHGVSHGHAVALTLGHFVVAHASADPDDLRDEVDPVDHTATMTEIIGILGATDGAGARDRFLQLIDRIGLANTLADVGVADERERSQLAAAVNVERLSNNPVRFDRDGLAGILEQAA